MKIAGHDIGVVSWSLRAGDMAELGRQVIGLGLQHVQLALGPLVALDDKRKHHELGQLRAAGVVVASGMIAFDGEDYSTIDTIRRTGGYVPDEQWTVRKKLSEQAAKLAAELGVRQVSTHVGFVPHAGEPGYELMVRRVAEIARAMADAECELLMETGQEGPSELLQFIADVGEHNVGVNFDPANLILYGAGDPIRAIHTLARHIRQVHAKDATASDQPGKTWGKEVVFGQGEVNAAAFLKALHDIGYTGPIIFEREAGDNAAEDVAAGIAALRNAAGGK